MSGNPTFGNTIEKRKDKSENILSTYHPTRLSCHGGGLGSVEYDVTGGGSVGFVRDGSVWTMCMLSVDQGHMCWYFLSCAQSSSMGSNRTGPSSMGKFNRGNTIVTPSSKYLLDGVITRRCC